MVRKTEPLVLGMAERLMDELRDVGAGQAVVDVCSLPPGPDDLGASQESEMTADGALRLLQRADQFGHTALALKQKKDELDPDRFGEGLEDFADPCEIVWIGSFGNKMLAHVVNLSSVLADKQNHGLGDSSSSAG